MGLIILTELSESTYSYSGTWYQLNTVQLLWEVCSVCPCSNLQHYEYVSLDGKRDVADVMK